MLTRIVEIADDHRHLFIHRGFFVVKDTQNEREELGRIPLDDIGAVIANAHGISYTNNLLIALAEQGAPFVLCANNHNAIGMLWPVEGHHLQAKRFDAQIEAKKPLKKRLWAEVIKSKIQQQASVLEAIGENSTPLQRMIKKVKSGDSENMEAQAARLYWKLLLGQDFKRDQQANDINSLLNYGYTILRSATARAIICAGLHPTLGIHHSNAGNPMRLVDDLMEPFRPIVDLSVYRLKNNNKTELTPEVKRKLVLTLYEDMQTRAGATPITTCLVKLATSLAHVYLGETNSLELPLPNLPLSLSMG